MSNIFAIKYLLLALYASLVGAVLAIYIRAIQFWLGDTTFPYGGIGFAALIAVLITYLHYRLMLARTEAIAERRMLPNGYWVLKDDDDHAQTVFLPDIIGSWDKIVEITIVGFSLLVVGLLYVGWQGTSLFACMALLLTVCAATLLKISRTEASVRHITAGDYLPSGERRHTFTDGTAKVSVQSTNSSEVKLEDDTSELREKLYEYRRSVLKQASGTAYKPVATPAHA